MPERFLTAATPGEVPTHEDVQQLIEAELGLGISGVHRQWLCSDSDLLVLISDSNGVRISRDDGTTAPAQVMVDGTAAGGALSGTYPSPGFASNPTLPGNVTITGTVAVGSSATVGGTLAVTGDAAFTSRVDVDGDVRLGNDPGDTVTIPGDVVVTGPGTFGSILVNGSSTLGNDPGDTVTVPGSLTVSGTGTITTLAVSGTGTLGTLSVTGTGTLGTLLVNGSSTLGNDSGDITTVSGRLIVGGDIDHNGSQVGFFGSSPSGKETVTGSRGGNVALANLLSALANYGLITNSTS